jgi:hypothetical protein
MTQKRHSDAHESITYSARASDNLLTTIIALFVPPPNLTGTEEFSLQCEAFHARSKWVGASFRQEYSSKQQKGRAG